MSRCWVEWEYLRSMCYFFRSIQRSSCERLYVAQYEDHGLRSTHAVRAVRFVCHSTGVCIEGPVSWVMARVAVIFLPCPVPLRSITLLPAQRCRDVWCNDTGDCIRGKGVRYIMPQHASLMELHVRREAPSELNFFSTVT